MTLEEEVARAMCTSGGYDPDETMANDGPRWRYYADLARAAIAVIEQRGREEERRAVVAWLRDYNYSECWDAADAIEGGRHREEGEHQKDEA